MSSRIESEYVDFRFGFPVVLRDVPVREVRGELVPEVNANDLKHAVLSALAAKSSPLTGDEVRFIRLWMGMTLAALGEVCGVSHVAVSKWEDKGDNPTKMARGTEFLLRILLLSKLPDSFVKEHVFADKSEETDSFLKELMQFLPTAGEAERLELSGGVLERRASVG